jgi:hypothetical protein
MSNAIRKFQRLNGGNQPAEAQQVDILLRGLQCLTIHPGDTVIIRTVAAIPAEQMKQLGWEKAQRIALATAVPGGM